MGRRGPFKVKLIDTSNMLVMQEEERTPGFLATFLGSVYNFKGYTTYCKRSGGSLFAQFLLLVVICCGLYASITTTWFKANISPFLDEMAVQVPAISVKDGKATVDIEQPYFYKIEGETVAIVDTTQPPEKYLEEYDAVMVLSEDKFFIKDDTGKIETYELSGDFVLSSTEVQGWIETGETWVFPGIFFLCFFWQVCWKAMQVLLVAGIITLVQSSRPDFTTHWKLANLALVPAMFFGVAVYAITLNTGIGIPGSGFVFWGILGGLTYWASEQLKKSPNYS